MAHSNHYCEELGLKTHRASESTMNSRFASDILYQSPYVSSLTSDINGNHYNITTDKNVNTTNWWDVPTLRGNEDYDQRLQKVSVSYSTQEIYSKANVDPGRSKQPSVRPSTSISSNNTAAVKLSSAGKEFMDYSSRRNEPRYSARLTDDRSNVPQTFTTNLTESEPPVKPQHAWVAEYTQHTADEKAPKSQTATDKFIENNKHNLLSKEELFTELRKIRFLSFEEAQQACSSSESDSEAEPVPENHASLSSTCRVLKTEHEELDLSAQTQRDNQGYVPVSSNQWIHSSKDKVITGKPLQETPEETHEIMTPMFIAKKATVSELTRIADSPQVPQVQSSDCNTVQEGMAIHDLNQADHEPVNEVQSQTEEEGNIVSRAINHEEADARSSKLQGIVDAADGASQPPIGIPPIDLSALEPVPSATRKVKASRKNVQAKSTSSGFSKFQSNATIKPKSQIFTQSTSFSKTRKIAADIRRCVNSRPSKKGSSNPPAENALLESRLLSTEYRKELSKVNNFSQPNLCVSKEYITALLSPRMTSVRGYEKLVEQTPRIEAGDVSVWECLPEEIWLNIVKHLNKSDLLSYALVCSSFNRIAYDRSLWRSVKITKKELSDIELNQVGQLSPSKLSIIQCTPIKINGQSVSNYGLTTLFRKCGHKLTSLCVRGCVLPPLSGETMLHHAVVHCQNIEHLDASWCNLTDHEIVLIQGSFLNITTLILNGNQNLTDSSLQPILVKLQNQLVRLELAGCFKMSAKTLPLIGACPNLEALSIGQCYKLNSTELQNQLSRLSNLNELGLKGLKQLKDRCITVVARKCQSIHSINISQCTELSNKALLEISCNLNNLQYIDASSCKNVVNDVSICALLANCQHLRFCDFSSTALTNVGVQKMAESCHKLEELRVNFCSVTEPAVRFLLGQVNSLKRLQLYGLKGVNVSDLSAAFPNIEIVN